MRVCIRLVVTLALLGYFLNESMNLRWCEVISRKFRKMLYYLNTACVKFKRPIGPDQIRPKPKFGHMKIHYLILSLQSDGTSIWIKIGVENLKIKVSYDDWMAVSSSVTHWAWNVTFTAMRRWRRFFPLDRERTSQARIIQWRNIAN